MFFPEVGKLMLSSGHLYEYHSVQVGEQDFKWQAIYGGAYRIKTLLGVSKVSSGQFFQPFEFLPILVLFRQTALFWLIRRCRLLS